MDTSNKSVNKTSKKFIDDEDNSALNESTEIEHESKKSKKSRKDKKKKDNNRDNAIFEEIEVESAPAAGVEDEVDEEERKQRKAEKKARKAAKRAAEREIESAVVESESSHMQSILSDIQPKTKKYKSNSGSKFGVYSHYIEDDHVIAMTPDEVETFRAEQGIQVSNDEDSALFKPLKSFAYLNKSLGSNCPYITKYFEAKKFSKPSAVQAQCWPALLAGRDVIGIAMTGSGKTLSFLVPGMLMLQLNEAIPQATRKGRVIPSPRMLIVAPTRELAMQSFQVIEEINGPKGICLYGGASKEAQIAQLRAGVDIVVATPGRLVDLIEGNAISLQSVIYSVLDEADRMLDEGFIPSIRQILAACPPRRSESTSASVATRQTVMFSATWPEEVRALAETFMAPDAVRVTVGSAELSANHRVTQIVEVLPDTSYPLRDRKLIELLEKYHKSRTNRCLIFVLYKKEATALQSVLQRKGYKVTSIHGDKSQVDRFAALNEFKDGSMPLMIATDVAARGLDIPQVEYVINYSFPLTVEDYVHRIGRTGRGGATGISHTFFTDNDKQLAAGLVGVLTEAKQTIPQEIYKYPMFTKKKPSTQYGNFGPKPELQGTKATKITFDD